MNVLNKWNRELQNWDSSEQHELIQNPKYSVREDSYGNFKCVDKLTDNEYPTTQQEIQIGSRMLKTGALKLQKEGCPALNDLYKSSCDDFFGMINARDQSYRTISNEIDKHIIGKQSKKLMDALSRASSLTKCIQQRKQYTDECVCVGDKGHYEYIAILENLREHYDLTVNSNSKDKFDLSDLSRYEKYDYPYTELKTDVYCKCYMLDKNGIPIKKKNLESSFIIKDVNQCARKIIYFMLCDFKKNPKSTVVYLNDIKKGSNAVKALNDYLLREILEFPIETVSTALKFLHTECMESINTYFEDATKAYTETTKRKDNPKLDDVCKLRKLEATCYSIEFIFNILSKQQTIQTNTEVKIPNLRWSKHTKWQDIYELVNIISYSVYLKIKQSLKDYFLN